MRVMKKTLGWVLVLAMIISMFPAVYATADDFSLQETVK